MSGTLMLVGNPRKRRTVAQKAATAKMIAANKARRRGGKKRGRPAAKNAGSTRTVVIAAAPTKRRAVSRRTRVVRRVRRYARRANSGYALGGIVPMVKNAGVGAAGAIGVDIVMGFASPYLPAMMQTPTAADGSVNYAYYMAKGGIAIGIGMLGRRLLGRYTGGIVMGSLIVTMHDLLQSFVRGSGMSIPLGYNNPARVLPPLPAAQNLRAYLPRGNSPLMQPRGLGAYVSAGARESLAR